MRSRATGDLPTNADGRVSRGGRSRADLAQEAAARLECLHAEQVRDRHPDVGKGFTRSQIDARLNLAKLLCERGRLKECSAQLEEVLRREPSNAKARVLYKKMTE